MKSCEGILNSQKYGSDYSIRARSKFIEMAKPIIKVVGINEIICDEYTDLVNSLRNTTISEFRDIYNQITKITTNLRDIGCRLENMEEEAKSVRETKILNFTAKFNSLRERRSKSLNSRVVNAHEHNAPITDIKAHSPLGPIPPVATSSLLLRSLSLFLKELVIYRLLCKDFNLLSHIYSEQRKASGSSSEQGKCIKAALINKKYIQSFHPLISVRVKDLGYMRNEMLPIMRESIISRDMGDIFGYLGRVFEEREIIKDESSEDIIIVEEDSDIGSSEEEAMNGMNGMDGMNGMNGDHPAPYPTTPRITKGKILRMGEESTQIAMENFRYKSIHIAQRYLLPPIISAYTDIQHILHDIHKNASKSLTKTLWGNYYPKQSINSFSIHYLLAYRQLRFVIPGGSLFNTSFLLSPRPPDITNYQFPRIITHLHQGESTQGIFDNIQHIHTQHNIMGADTHFIPIEDQW